MQVLAKMKREDMVGTLAAASMPNGLIDPLGRHISYLRISVTDRCDFRCTYCMAENMTFLPKKDLLSLDELYRLSNTFISKGVRKIRISGGEPLVRRDVMGLFSRLGEHIGSGLDEITLTTNGSQLSRYAHELARSGVRRINVSIDTLDPHKFKQITRRGELVKVLEGLDAAQDAGLKVKLNVVALKDINEAEIPSLIEYAHSRNMDITLIETMPLGEIEEDRTDRFLSLKKVRADLAQVFTLEELALRTSGPARYVKVLETNGRLGFITPLTHNFCDSCNRVRLTCTGKLYMCLGQNDAADLRSVMRTSSDDAVLEAAIDEAISRKPRAHDFIISPSYSSTNVSRHMSVTGG